MKWYVNIFKSCEKVAYYIGREIRLQKYTLNEDTICNSKKFGKI